MPERPLDPTGRPRRLEAIVSGRVQGVGFRMFVLDRATARDLTGWVANEAGGAVRVVAEGAADDLDGLLSDLRDGPRGARVERVDETWTDAAGAFGRFSIRSGWHSGD